nr:hypothetical protein [Tanacetum cinerariifolium]
MTHSTDSSLTRRNDSNLLWKSSDISFRFAQEYRVETLMPFLSKKTLCCSYENSVIQGRSIHSMMLLSIRCINPRELFPFLSTKDYLERLEVLTSFVSPELKSFGKTSPSKKASDLVPVDEEPATKGKLIKKSVKKSSTKPTTGIVIREPTVETKSKRKKKVDVTRGKGIDLLSEVAYIEEAQMKEVRNKSLRDFYKLHPSGSGTVSKKPLRVDKITPPVTSEGTGDKPGVPDVTKDELTKSNDDENKSDDDKTPSDNEKGLDSEQDSDGSETDFESDQQEYDDDEVKDDDDDKSEGDEDRGMEDTTNQFSDDVQDIHPNDAEIVSPLDVHVHHEVPGIHTSALLTTTPTSPPTIKTTNIPPSIPDFASVFRFNNRFIALEKDVAELKKDPLHTQVTALVDDHLNTRMRATREEFMNFLSASLTDRITEQVRNQLPQILPEEVFNFAPPVIEKMITESFNQVNLAKASSQPQSTYEVVTTLTEFELKKILNDKMNSSESYLTAPKHQEYYDGLIKSYNLDKDFFSSYDVYSLKKTVHSEEPEFEVGDTDTPQGQEGNRGNDDVEPKKESASRRDWFTKPSRPQEPTDPNWNEDKTPQKGPTQNWLMTLVASTSTGGISTMTYTTSTTKTKATQYDLPGIKDMVLNIWSLVKVTYDKYASWGISHWREQCKSFYAYARGKQSRGDVYFTKRILAVTYVLVMRKHGYAYLEEIVVRRADNTLYKFKEGGDVADFAIALRMLTRSLVIQKRVQDLQLGVKSYQKQINITKPDTTRLELRKRHPYTPYKDPQGFIYFNDYQRNRHYQEYRHGVLAEEKMEQIRKEKSSFMIKDINKLLKERRMMRSLEKFVGGRLYGTDLRLLQRTI